MTSIASRRPDLAVRGPLAFAALLLLARPNLAQEVGVPLYREHVARYLQRIYGPEARRLAFRSDYPGGFQQWQSDARAALVQKLGLKLIADSVGRHRAKVELGATEDLGEYTRQEGSIETEPDVRLPFWLLRPKTKGPWPLAIFPHGHSRKGHDTSAGVFAADADRQKALAEDRDVAVQAASRGWLAIAPTVRGLSADGVPDVKDRHGKLDCRSHVMHCLLAGRTAIGERVWDIQRLLDWACALPEVNARRTLLMGNSAGGIVTLYAAACDARVSIAVPSCSFAPSATDCGFISHCDCDMVPGLIELGGLSDVAGLIAPRCLLTVNGRKDPLFSVDLVEQGVARVRAIYQAAGHPERYDHRWGEAGHRFYKDLMWPFIAAAMP